MKKCPFCAEEIQDDAIKCRFCGEWLEGKGKQSPTTGSPKPVIVRIKKSKSTAVFLAIFLGGLGIHKLRKLASM